MNFTKDWFDEKIVFYYTAVAALRCALLCGEIREIILLKNSLFSKNVGFTEYLYNVRKYINLHDFYIVAKEIDFKEILQKAKSKVYSDV